MKVVTIVGARPQFIKAAPVSRALSAIGIEEVLVHTGQHYDSNMSDIFFEELRIPKPDHHLGVGGGGHGQMTGRQLEKIEKVLLATRPHWVIVYGDTNSTVAGALAAAKLNIPVAHVEAGLRSFNRRMPEEVNRVVADHISELLFVPTAAACRNVLREGIAQEKIRMVGDVMYDAALFYRKIAREPDWFAATGLQREDYVLCTIHRAENTDDGARLRAIFEGLASSGLPVLLPTHPRTRARICEVGVVTSPNIHLVAPVGYLEMIWLEMNCRVVATDSGGVQKEAYFHRKPCITLREETEWVELVEHGWNTLTGVDPWQIATALQRAEEKEDPLNLYGDGQAAALIAEALV